jgi:hypothetical protein
MTDGDGAAEQERALTRWLRSPENGRLKEWRRKWDEAGFCTIEADRESAERAVVAMYRAAEIPPPRIVWCGSPHSLLLAYVRGAERWDAINRRLERVDLPLSPILRDSIGQAVLSGLKEAIGPAVFHSVTRSLDLRQRFASTRRWLLHSILMSLEEWRRFRRHEWERELLFGQHDADWLAVLDFFRDAHGWAEKSEGILGLIALGRAAGWALPRANVCWVSERPVVVRRDDVGRLHCANGPALVYPDGWESYFWHGVSILADWLARRNTIEPQLIITWPQAEQRSALVEIAGGWLGVVARLPTRIVDDDPDRSIGTLLECTLDDGTARFLRVLCGTGRTFALPVPRGCMTARQANAWTYGLGAREYSPEVRT